MYLGILILLIFFTVLYITVKCVAFFVKCFVRILLAMVNYLYCVPTYVVWMVMVFPLRKHHPNNYWRVEGHFFHWLLAMISMWTWCLGYDVVELGDNIRMCLEDRTLVIANHQSTTDVPLLMATFNAKKNILPNIMWIMSRVFKYTIFGIVSILHQDFFIVRGRDRRDLSLQELMEHIRTSYILRNRKWIVLFPEGGFLRNMRKRSQRFALKNNLPVLQHVSLPRVGAFQTIVEEAGDTVENLANNNILGNVNKSFYKNRVNWVLDITIAYPEGKPLDFGHIVTGSRDPCKTFLLYRLFSCSLIPRDAEAMKKWLYDRFVKKDRLLDIFYRTGHFPVETFCSAPVPQQEVSQDVLRFAILHLFFITSSYIHYQMFSYVASCLWY